MIDDKLLDILGCPQCKGPLTPELDNPDIPRLICSACQLAFPFQDDIPVLLLSRTEKLGMENNSDDHPDEIQAS